MPSENNKKEIRIIHEEDLELRIEGDGEEKRLVGYAAKFNKWSLDLGFFREKIAPGAFKDALKTSDVRALKNHDANLLLGRTEANTLRLTENKVGLKFELDIPNTTTGQDTLEEVRRGDISGCSFAFTLEGGGDAWEYPDDGIAERTITSVGELFDVGPVTYPAYPDTTVAARSMKMDSNIHIPTITSDSTDNPESYTLDLSKPVDPEIGRTFMRKLEAKIQEAEGTPIDKQEKPKELDLLTRHKNREGYKKAGRILRRCTAKIAEAKKLEEKNTV